MDEEPKMKFDMTREISICCEREEEGLSLPTSIITEQEKIGDAPNGTDVRESSSRSRSSQ